MKKIDNKTLYKIFVPVALLLIVLVIVGVQQGNQDNIQNGGISESGETEENKTIAFPYELEEGKLEITSLFQSDVPNPDKDFEEGKNLATIELLNKSKQYLTSADIVLSLVDGTQVKFRIEDIPTGKKVWAFDLENTEIAADSECVSITCTAEFSETASDWDTKFQAEANASLVTVTNLTDEMMTDVEATFHCLMDDTYFGGISYKYSIEELLPQSSTELEVIECSFGDAQMVLIEP